MVLDPADIGNVGSASIWLMLDALLKIRPSKRGEKILCVVPESGRALVGFMMLEAVMSVADVGPDAQSSPAVADVLRKLAMVFTEFEGRLEQTPLIRKLTRGRFALDDYQAFLINLRQQVKDGALWMSRAASNIDEEHLELRSPLMRHAVTEHRDFRLLEADYVATGGDAAEIQSAEKNIGSEALSAWMFHRGVAAQSVRAARRHVHHRGPGLDQGAGVGTPGAEAPGAARGGGALPALSRRKRRRAYGGIRAMLGLVLPDDAIAARIVTCAKVTARLYALQIEEIEA